MDQSTVNLTVGGSGRAGQAASVLPPPDPTRPVRSLYIHTPFCSHKCHYCDFYSFVDDAKSGGDAQRAFVDRLILELRSLAPWARGAPLRTIFIGGGTPSLLRIELWEQLLRVLAHEFDLSAIRTATGDTPAPDGHPEFTVECNPESTTADLCAVLKAGGITRISMGAQSFIPHHLKTLERRHDPESVEPALERIRAAGIRRQSIDLIYAIPGQTLDEWGSDLDRALSLGTTHLSCYNLTYEPQTLMTARMRRGEFTPIDEDLEAAMFELTTQKLEPHGLRRYEVSNYARPGMESRHNLAYWYQEDWLAAGPSASGHVRGVRTKNVGNIRMYLESSGTSPLSEAEPVDPVRAVREKLMTGIRLARGLSAAETLVLAESASTGAAARLSQAVSALRRDGLLADDDSRWRVEGERAWLLADWIAKQMMAAVGE